MDIDFQKHLYVFDDNAAITEGGVSMPSECQNFVQSIEPRFYADPEESV